MYVFAAFYGMNLGSSQSYSRSLFSFLIPIGRESEMFSIYGYLYKPPSLCPKLLLNIHLLNIEITDKGSSWIGPMMVAFVSNFASMRWALFYIATFFMVSFPLIYYKVDPYVGAIQAGRSIAQHNPRSASAILAHADNIVDLELVLKAPPGGNNSHLKRPPKSERYVIRKDVSLLFCICPSFPPFCIEASVMFGTSPQRYA